MPKSGKHLTFENREVIEQGIMDGDSASRIARRLGVAASTVTREAKAHRTVRPKKMSAHERASLRCAKRPSCSKSDTDVGVHPLEPLRQGEPAQAEQARGAPS